MGGIIDSVRIVLKSILMAGVRIISSRWRSRRMHFTTGTGLAERKAR
jgi:hypothetical protein